MAQHLLDGASVDQYVDALQAAVGSVAAGVSAAGAPRSDATLPELAALVDAVDLDDPLADLPAALGELDELYLRHAVWFHHPRYMAHLNCPVLIPSLAAEAVLSAVNTSMDTWDQSTSATLMEQRLIAWAARRAGLPASADGVFTSGGTQSNLQALLLARERALEDVPAADRPRRQADLRVLCSAEAHFSIGKSARLLGLADDAVVPVATDADGRLDVAAIRQAVAGIRDSARTVMAVVATAGTTDRGHLDPLDPIGRFCRDAGVWFHVDAAWGCGLLVSARHRHLLEGIQHADSITADFHKSFFQPVSSSALLVREAHTLRHVTVHADYLNPATDVRPNQVDKSLQTTRRNDAVKLWLTLRAVGPDAIGAMVDTTIDLAAAAAVRIDADPELTTVTVPELSSVLFRWQPPGVPDAVVDALTPGIRTAMFDAGKALIAGTVIAGRPCLKLTLLNPNATLDDVAAVLAAVAATGRELLDAASASVGAGPDIARPVRAEADR